MTPCARTEWLWGVMELASGEGNGGTTPTEQAADMHVVRHRYNQVKVDWNESGVACYLRASSSLQPHAAFRANTNTHPVTGLHLVIHFASSFDSMCINTRPPHGTSFPCFLSIALSHGATMYLWTFRARLHGVLRMISILGGRKSITSPKLGSLSLLWATLVSSPTLGIC